ncbi:MAG: outer membrane beta-barrel protein [Bacteroidales bacterium]|nr:outer membrane beta-barrel protein [Bacteroidales bacterium]
MKNLKSFFGVFILMLFVFSVHGQTTRGTILIGGESNFDLSSMNSKWKSDDGSGSFSNTISLGISPKIGFFIIDNLAVGVKLPIGFQFQKDKNNDKYSSTSLGISPFLKYYFGTSNIKPYLNGSVGFSNLVMKDNPVTGPSDKNTVGMFSFELGGGFGIFLNDKVSVDIGVGYNYSSYKDKENNNNNYRRIYSGVGLGAGISISL